VGVECAEFDLFSGERPCRGKRRGTRGIQPDIVGVTWFLVALSAEIYLAASYVGGSGGVG